MLDELRAQRRETLELGRVVPPRELRVSGVHTAAQPTYRGAAAQSLRSFSKGVVLILGGKDKGGTFADLVPLIRGRVTHLVLLGKAKESIAKQIGPVVPTILVEDMEDAVAAARVAAAPGGVVLLAPGCASFDQYSGFEARGEHFRTLVNALGEATS